MTVEINVKVVNLSIIKIVEIKKVIIKENVCSEFVILSINNVILIIKNQKKLQS